MRVLVVQSMTNSEKPWWYHHMPQSCACHDVEIAHEPKFGRDGWSVYWELLRLYLRLNDFDAVVTLQDGHATFLFLLSRTFPSAKTVCSSSA